MRQQSTLWEVRVSTDLGDSIIIQKNCVHFQPCWSLRQVFLNCKLISSSIKKGNADKPQNYYSYNKKNVKMPHKVFKVLVDIFINYDGLFFFFFFLIYISLGITAFPKLQEMHHWGHICARNTKYITSAQSFILLLKT